MAGECSLDIVFPADTASDTFSLTAHPGGRLLNAAAILGDCGYTVEFAGEASRDLTGDIITGFLARHNVSTRSIDRYTAGVTPAYFLFENRDEATVAMRSHAAEGFDFIWPRVDADDIVIFGSYFALDKRIRPNLTDFLTNAAERKATIIYLPGFLSKLEPSITKVMPFILENLQFADMVVTRSGDFANIFGADATPESSYRDHISFYTRLMANVDDNNGTISIYHGKDTVTTPFTSDKEPLQVNAIALAALTDALIQLGITHDNADSLPSGLLRMLASQAADFISSRK